MVNVLYAHKSHPVESLGIGYLASSIARGGHGTKIILTGDGIDIAINEICEELDKGDYRVFGQSVIFGSHGYAMKLSEKIKERHPEIISFLGGPAPTFTPQLINYGNFDAICRYEGENPFLEFMNAIEAGDDVGNIPNIWVKENPNLYRTEVKRKKTILDQDHPGYKDESGYDPINKIFVNETRALLTEEELNNLPFPDREVLHEIEKWRDGPIDHYIGTRGCVFSCLYCHVHVQNADNRGKGSPVRRRSLESIAQEMLEYKRKRRERGDTNETNDYDQSDIEGYSYNVKFAKEQAEVLGGISNNRHIHTRYDLVSRDEDIAKYLAMAGVTGAHIAIEAGNPYIRNVIHGRGMSDEQILIGAKYMHANGIKTMTQNILGAVGETKENMFETLLINQKVNPTFASASIFQPFPGTNALEHAAKTGALPPGFEKGIITMSGFETFYNRTLLIMNEEQKDWLEGFQKFFAIAVEEKWSPEKVDQVIGAHAKGGSTMEELEEMYRTHRAEKDNELYGIKLTNVVMKEKATLQGGLAGRDVKEF